MKPQGTTTARALRHGGILLALLVLGLMVFGPGLDGPFLMDDYDAIHPLAASEASGNSWTEVLRNAPGHTRARVVSNYSFLLTRAARGAPWPPEPRGYKLDNLLIHVTTSFLVFLLGLRLLPRAGLTPQATAVGAVLASLLFLLHPLQVSTVLYAVQRMAQLATLFALAAVLIYVHWRSRVDRMGEVRHWAWVAVVAALMALAVLSKENGALAALLIAVVELVFFRWPPRAASWRSRFEAGFGVVCAGPLVLGATLLLFRWPAIVAGYASREYDMGERLLTQIHVIWSYVGNLAWPDITRMGLYRDDVAIVTTADAATIALGLLLLGLVALALIMRKRWPLAAVGVLWFLAAHAMESTVISLELVFEHRNYLAVPGLCLALGGMLAKLRPTAALVLGALIAVTLAWLTFQRATQWSDYGLWIRSEATNHPLSRRATGDLATHLARRGEYQEAGEVVAGMRQAFPAEAFPAVIALWLHCAPSGPLARSTDSGDLARFRKGRVSKDAFHAFDALLGARDAGRCDGLGLDTLAEAAGLLASNPHLRDQPRALAAWNRAHAGVLARLGDWPSAHAALARVVSLQDDHPPDWLMLMRARLALNDATGYLEARARLLGLTQGRLGPLTTDFQRTESAAAVAFGTPEPNSTPDHPGD